MLMKTIQRTVKFTPAGFHFKSHPEKSNSRADMHTNMQTKWNHFIEFIVDIIHTKMIGEISSHTNLLGPPCRLENATAETIVCVLPQLNAKTKAKTQLWAALNTFFGWILLFRSYIYRKHERDHNKVEWNLFDYHLPMFRWILGERKTVTTELRLDELSYSTLSKEERYKERIINTWTLWFLCVLIYLMEYWR